MEQGDYATILSDKYGWKGLGRIVYILPEFKGKLEFHIDIMMAMCNQDNPLYLVQRIGKDPNQLYGFNKDELVKYKDGLERAKEKAKD
jgi:hypothetical protein